MSTRPKLWQWPNMLAVDAAVIAVAWQWIFSQSTDNKLTLAVPIVLGLSVWLTYMADRLFDSQKRPAEQLLSLRHQFAKQHGRQIWKLWTGVLFINILIAVIFLTGAQFQQGCYLLAACLLYTLLNQRLSKRFFPKEFLVALIFTGGVAVFLEAPLPSFLMLGVFALLCFTNCLILGEKEQAVDNALQVQSISTSNSKTIVWTCLILGFLMLTLGNDLLVFSLSIPLFSVAMLYLTSSQFSVETFRVVLDGTLLLGVIPWLWA